MSHSSDFGIRRGTDSRPESPVQDHNAGNSEQFDAAGRKTTGFRARLRRIAGEKHASADRPVTNVNAEAGRSLLSVTAHTINNRYKDAGNYVNRARSAAGQLISPSAAETKDAHRTYRDARVESKKARETTRKGEQSKRDYVAGAFSTGAQRLSKAGNTVAAHATDGAHAIANTTVVASQAAVRLGKNIVLSTPMKGVKAVADVPRAYILTATDHVLTQPHFAFAHKAPITDENPNGFEARSLAGLVGADGLVKTITGALKPKGRIRHALGDNSESKGQKVSRIRDENHFDHVQSYKDLQRTVRQQQATNDYNDARIDQLEQQLGAVHENNSHLTALNEGLNETNQRLDGANKDNWEYQGHLDRTIQGLRNEVAQLKEQNETQSASIKEFIDSGFGSREARTNAYRTLGNRGSSASYQDPSKSYENIARFADDPTFEISNPQTASAKTAVYSGLPSKQHSWSAPERNVSVRSNAASLRYQPSTIYEDDDSDTETKSLKSFKSFDNVSLADSQHTTLPLQGKQHLVDADNSQKKSLSMI